MDNRVIHLHCAPRPHLQGVVTLPPDKSILHRALIMAALSTHETVIEAVNPGDDNLSTVNVLRQLGVSIEQTPTAFHVKGVGKAGLKPSNAALDCGNSGTTLRLMAGVLSAQCFESELTGDASLSMRPMQRIVEPLSLMGANVSATGGCAPLTIKPVAALNDLHYDLPVASAQVKSAIQLAAYVADVNVCVNEPQPVRDHTSRLLDYWPKKLPATPLAMPADFSSAAFFIVAAVIAQRGDVSMRGVGMNPTRTALLKYLILMGATISLSNHRWFGHEPVADVHVKQARYLQPIRVLPQDMPNLIDELPVLFIAAACAKGTSTFPNVAELRVKESDRLAAMMNALQAMGVHVELNDDTLHITGQDTLDGITFNAQGDHRIQMALTMASVRANAPIVLTGPQCVSVSFPEFLSACRHLGMRIKQESPQYA